MINFVLPYGEDQHFHNWVSITIHESWCTHFVQESQGFEPNDREDVLMFYASALQSLQYFYQTQVRSLPCPCVHDMLDAFEGLTYRTLVVDNFSWQKLLVFYWHHQHCHHQCLCRVCNTFIKPRSCHCLARVSIMCLMLLKAWLIGLWLSIISPGKSCWCSVDIISIVIIIIHIWIKRKSLSSCVPL